MPAPKIGKVPAPNIDSGPARNIGQVPVPEMGKVPAVLGTDQPILARWCDFPGDAGHRIVKAHHGVAVAEGQAREDVVKQKLASTDAVSLHTEAEKITF